MRERSFPQSLGSSAANSGALSGKASFNNSIPTNIQNVNGNISEMDEDGAPGAARPTEDVGEVKKAADVEGKKKESNIKTKVLRRDKNELMRMQKGLLKLRRGRLQNSGKEVKA